MKVNKYLLPVFAVVMLMGPVLIAQATGAWVTVTTTTATIGGVTRPDPAGIMGSMSLQYVSDNYGIPLDRLYEMIGLPASQDPTATLKSLKSVIPTFETESVRTGIREFYEETGVQVTEDATPNP